MPEEREQDIGKDITQDTPTDAPGNIVNVEVGASYPSHCPESANSN